MRPTTPGRPSITPEQYDVMVKLMRGDPASASNRAARRVLVDGLSQAEAMRETGVTRATVNGAVRRYTLAYKLICSAFGIE